MWKHLHYVYCLMGARAQEAIMLKRKIAETMISSIQRCLLVDPPHSMRGHGVQPAHHKLCCYQVFMKINILVRQKLQIFCAFTVSLRDP